MDRMSLREWSETYGDLIVVDSRRGQRGDCDYVVLSVDRDDDGRCVMVDVNTSVREVGDESHVSMATIRVSAAAVLTAWGEDAAAAAILDGASLPLDLADYNEEE